MRDFLPLDAVLAHLEDGTPGMTAASYGKGQAMLVGSFIGLANQPSYRNNNEFLLGLLDWAKVTRPFKTSQDGLDPELPLEARLQKNPEGYLLFLINHTKNAKPVTLNVNVDRDGDYTLREILRNRSERKRSEGRALKLATELPAKQVEVWDIRAGQ